MERKELVYQIADSYICKYTCAEMYDTQRQIDDGIAKANDWLFKQINENHITMEELKSSVSQVEDDWTKEHKPCYYAEDLFSTKFFRK